MTKVDALGGCGRAVCAALSVFLGSACGSSSDPLDTHGPSSSSQASGGGPGGGPSGDPAETGDEPTGGTGGATEGTTDDPTTGGLVPTRELCDRYLECLAVTQPEALPSAQMGFGADGTCWDGPPEQIQQCITACYTGLGDSHEAFPDEPKCSQCAEDSDCVTGERCVMGGCYVSYCGDGLVEDSEICDDPDDLYCAYDCSWHEFVECNLFSSAGCSEGKHCAYSHDGLTGCIPDDTESLGDGAVCQPGGSEYCGQGLVCASAELIDGCPGAGCCTLVCNTQEPDECPDGRVCQPEPYSNYIGLCVLLP